MKTRAPQRRPSTHVQKAGSGTAAAAPAKTHGAKARPGDTFHKGASNGAVAVFNPDPSRGPPINVGGLTVAQAAQVTGHTVADVEALTDGHRKGTKIAAGVQLRIVRVADDPTAPKSPYQVGDLKWSVGSAGGITSTAKFDEARANADELKRVGPNPRPGEGRMVEGYMGKEWQARYVLQSDYGGALSWHDNWADDNKSEAY